MRNPLTVFGSFSGEPGVWVADLSPFLLAIGTLYPPLVVVIIVTLPLLHYAEDGVRTMGGRI